MINPYNYMVKTKETLQMGKIHYDDLMEWCGDDPERAYYLLNVFFVSDEVLDQIIGVDAKYSYLYAKHVLKGRFELGEDAISKDTGYSYLYAKHVLKGRFELGENAIAKNVGYAYLYTKEVLKGRFVLGEEAILNSEYKEEYLDLINQ